MSFPARGEYIKLGKGALFLDVYANGVPTGNYDFVGNVNSLNLSADITTAQLRSSTQASGALIDKRVLASEYTMAAACNEVTLNNIALFMLGTRNTKAQSLGTDQEVRFTNVKPGQAHDVGARNITNAQLFRQGNSSPLAIDVDYTLDAAYGIFKSIVGGQILEDDDLIANFDKPAASIQQVRIASAASKTAKLLYVADDANEDGRGAKDRLELWRVSVVPDGDFGFIGDDYASFNLQFSILSDGTTHPTDPFGTLDRIGDPL